MARLGNTEASGELLHRYLREIGSHPLLTAAEEVELAETMERGRQASEALAARPRSGRSRATASRTDLERAVLAGNLAKRRFIQSNLRLVVSIAKRYQSSGMTLLDLVQEGNLGLIRAVERFEPSRGCKFSTYATWWVRQSISRAIADKGRTIRVPVHLLDTVRRVNRSAGRLQDGLGREATADEVARDIGIPVAAVVAARRLLPDSVSLQLPVADGDGELADLIEDRDAQIPFDRADAALRSDALRAALESLSDREQQVLTMRFGLGGTTPRTLEQVGRDFQLTRERIRQIEAKAITRLRHPAGAAARRGPAGRGGDGRAAAAPRTGGATPRPAGRGTHAVS